MSKMVELAETVTQTRQATWSEFETMKPWQWSIFDDRMARLRLLEKRLSRSTPKTIAEAAALAEFIVTWNLEDDTALVETAAKRLAAGLARMAAPTAGSPRAGLVLQMQEKAPAVV